MTPARLTEPRRWPINNRFWGRNRLHVTRVPRHLQPMSARLCLIPGTYAIS